MRLRFDENLPRLARTAAASLGHDVDTFVDEGLGGAGDPDAGRPEDLAVLPTLIQHLRKSDG